MLINSELVNLIDVIYAYKRAINGGRSLGLGPIPTGRTGSTATASMRGERSNARLTQGRGCPGAWLPATKPGRNAPL